MTQLRSMRFATLLALAALAGCGSQGSGGAAVGTLAQGLTSGAVYTIVGVQSGRCVNIAGASTADVAAAELRDCSSATSQQFRLEAASTSGYYALRNVNSGKCLDVTGASTAAGAAIIQYACHGGTNQQWSTTDVGSGAVRITSRASGMVVDAYGARTANGTKLIQWRSNGGTNQQWKLTEVGSVTSYSLTIATSGSGTTSPAAGTYSYASGTAVTVTATPASGYTFTGWSGAATGTANPVTVTINGNKTLTASFAAAATSYTLTIATSGSGTTSPAAGTYTYASGASVAVTATAASGYTFTGWSGAATGTANPLTITVTGNMTLMANFAPATAHTQADLAAKLGKPARLLVGLGSTDQSDIAAQGITPDIFERYLVGSGQNLQSGWQTWNSPEGAYVNLVAGAADAVGAVPMYTLYMSTARGEGNLAYLGDSAFMAQYWHLAKLLFQRLAIYGKPALVSVEPDFWGFVESQAPGGDPTKVAAQVKVEPDCAAYANDLTGLAACYIHLARTYAPKARIGFPPSSWGAPSLAENIAFMNKVGVGAADFTVLQTVDRDAGCYEAGIDSNCTRPVAYWDESNATSPNFNEYLATAKQYRDGIGRPLIWWQTPLGVPSNTPGGTPNHYRDNRVHYFLTHPSELVAAGGVGVVFGAGWGTQTNITTDNGQFKNLSAAYFANPALLP